MGFTISEVYRCKPDDEALRLIHVFASMVKWWAERGKDFPGGPYEAFRKMHYRAWAEGWPEWNRQLIHTSVNTAFGKLRLGLSPKDRPKLEAVDLNIFFAVLHPKMVKIANEVLRISAYSGREGYVYVKLLPNSPHQKKLIEQAEAGEWQLGQVVLTKSWAIIPFTAEELNERKREAIVELLPR